jgi:hypothetical protein
MPHYLVRPSDVNLGVQGHCCALARTVENLASEEPTDFDPDIVGDFGFHKTV